MDFRSLPDIHEVWGDWLASGPQWESLISGGEPKQSGCGEIYEIECPLDRPYESLAIADMRQLDVAEPHYHNGNETEVYLVLQGSGVVFIAGDRHDISRGDYLVIDPEKAHYTFPERDLVLAVLNSPPFDPEKYICLSETNPEVGFDAEEFAAQKQLFTS